MPHSILFGKSDSLKFSVIFLRSLQDIYVQTLTKAGAPTPYMDMVASITEAIKDNFQMKQETWKIFWAENQLRQKHF
jgi:hypothetical protein